MAEPLKCNGVGRDKDCISALQFYFSRRVTDDEKRFLYDVMRRAAACMPSQDRAAGGMRRARTMMAAIGIGLAAAAFALAVAAKIAHADERPIVWTCEQEHCVLTTDEFRELRRIQWLHRYGAHPQHCRLVDNPNDGLVSGPTPQVCAPPEAPRYPPGAGRGLFDPRQPERSFAR